jgi:hypothetical protein
MDLDEIVEYILEEGELTREAVVANFATTAKED